MKIVVKIGILFAIILCFFIASKYSNGLDRFASFFKPKPEVIETIVVQVDTVTVTKTVVKHDTVKVRVPQIKYITKDNVVVKTDTVFVYKDQVQSLFGFESKAFTVSALTYADCLVDSIKFDYVNKPKYWTDFANKHYKKGYIEGRRHYPTWKKVSLYALGVVTAGGIGFALK